MNKSILMGRMTKDAETRYSQGENQTAISRFTLAVDRKGKKDEADFISCVAFGKLGEFFEKYGKKGTKFLVSGHIQTGSYTKQNGEKVYTTDIIIDEAEFAESKASQGNQTGFNAINAPVEVEDDGFKNIPEGIDEELPFRI